jgi:signal transduction histidine kinase/ligand-binding sensor domain-containing protein
MRPCISRYSARRVHYVTARVIVIIIAIAVAESQRAVAAERAPFFTVSAWTAQTGMPAGDVLAMAQDVRGYLWLGTSNGLVRFDGASFVPWNAQAQVPELSVPALVGARDGSLWIGYGGPGGVSRIYEGTRVTYSERDGLVAGTITTLIEDREGVVWAGGRSGLSRFQNGRWHSVKDADGYDGAEIYSAYEDRSGRLWLGTADGVFVRDGGEFERRYPAFSYVQSFAEDAAGHLWVTDTREIARRLDTGEAPTRVASIRVPQSGWRLLRGRHEELWIAALGGGLLRLDHPGSGHATIDRFAYESRHTGSPRSLFTDRDNNLWVGMRGGGLLRVAESVIENTIPLDGLTNDGVRAVGAGVDGSVWVATGHSLNHFGGGGRHSYNLSQTLMLHTDRGGSMWAPTAHGLGRIEDGRFTPVRLPSEIRWEGMRSVASDSTGALWLCSFEQGVMVWRAGELSRFSAVPEVGNRACSYSYTDRRGRVWLGFRGGGVVVYDNRAFHRYDSSDGLAKGPVLAIAEDRKGDIWIAARDGISRLQNARFTTISADDGPFDGAVASLVEDDDGFLWIGVKAGAAVVRINPREMDKAAINSVHQIEYRLYDISDGMLGELRWQARDAGVRGGDGRLWFATGPGVVVIDPRNLPPTPRPASPHIDSVNADGQAIPPQRNLTLASETSRLTINYGAVSLGSASKLRFRYRLEGLEPDWLPAGARRSVTYSRLEPGAYRFRVSATTDGIWSEAGVWEFAVAKPFYRATWFYALMMVAVACSLGAAWWLRLRAVRHQYALVLAERARMSREIHDTLLQSLAGIGLELEAITGQLEPSQLSARESIRRLRRQVGHSLREARDSVWGLRQNAASQIRGLVPVLQSVADQTTSDRNVFTELAVSGRRRPCSDEVELQLLRICQEAVSNAIRHGRATRIHITVEFDENAVTLSIADNGCGFNPGDPIAAATGKHLGLIGMAERAERIGGRFLITSAPGAGTVVQASSPYVE